MTQENVLQYNTMCAEVVGLKRGWWISQEKPLTDDKKQWWDINGKTFLGTKVYYDKDLKFHSDWNWIMEVVEAIEKLGFNTDFYSPIQYSTDNFHEFNIWNKPTSDIQGRSKIKKEAVVQAINQFLISYKQNKL